MKQGLGKETAKAARELEGGSTQLAGYPVSATEHGEAALELCLE